MGGMPPMEVEAKYRVPNTAALEQALENVGARFLGREEHRDTYLRHPCRDFRTTDEALRIRVVDGKPWITYKGPRRAGPVKVRPEIELALGASDLKQWLDVWTALGFVPLATVAKIRRTYQLHTETRPLLISLDSVQSIGVFAEIERLVAFDDEVDQAKADIVNTAQGLGLDRDEPKSYLSLILESSSQ